MELVIGIISSILATLIVATTVYAYRRGLIHVYWDHLVSWLLPSHTSSEKDKTNDPDRVRRILIRLLRRDQSRTGPHYGQFGRSASLDEQEKYQTGSEKLSLKPRLYLTNWPCTILKEHNLEPRSIRIAANGIERLFVNSRVYVYQSATQQTPPHHQPQIISYRHTICGALLLHHVKGWIRIVRNVVDAMLDDRNDWQKADGGWAQCDREHTQSDLWGSAYALRLLQCVLDDSKTFSSAEHTLAFNAISRTIAYFRKCWEKNEWSYGKSLSEENAVILLIEIAPVLLRHDRQFLDTVVAHTKQWLSPSGDLSESYLATCKDIPRTVLYARMSYALCLGQQSTSLWLPLYYRSVENLTDDLNSADMSFLIALSYQCEENREGK